MLDLDQLTVTEHINPIIPQPHLQLRVAVGVEFFQLTVQR
jgi:hypothetical protein